MNFAWVVIDWILEKINSFNHSTFSSKDRQGEDNMPFGCHLMRIFKHFQVKLNEFESKQVIESKKKLHWLFEIDEALWNCWKRLCLSSLLERWWYYGKSSGWSDDADRVTIRKATDDKWKTLKMRKEAEIGESVQPSETIDAHSGEIPSLRQ